MAITAGTTVLGHSDECRARIEQKMLEDVTDEGAMCPEEAIRRKSHTCAHCLPEDLTLQVAQQNLILVLLKTRGHGVRDVVCQRTGSNIRRCTRSTSTPCGWLRPHVLTGSGD